MFNSKTLHSNNTNLFVYIALCFLSVFLAITVTYLHLGNTFMLARSIAETALIFSPLLFLKKKYVGFALIPAWAIPLFLLSNVWYHRFFGDFMPLTSYFLFNNVDETVINSVKGLVKIKDFSFLILPLVASCYYIYFSRNVKHNNLRPLSSNAASLFTIGIIVAYLGSFYLTPLGNSFLKTISDTASKRTASLYLDYQACGPMAYLGITSYKTYKLTTQDRSLSESDKKMINEYFNIQKQISESTPPHQS